jgi:MoaA/NifB/PqqE/SkfB family radical SAM enzyme
MGIFRKRKKSLSPEKSEGQSLKDIKSENLERIRESFLAGDEKVEAYPPVLYIEATSICNLRCPMCPITMDIPTYRYPVKHFRMELLEKLEPALKAARRCFLSGGGEPLLHPRLFDIIRAVKRGGSEIIFNSNAVLLGEEESRMFIETGVDCISFSIDGATRETYEAIRVPANFEKVISNIKGLARLKKESGADLPFINVQLTVQDSNKHEIPDIIPLAESLGANQVVVEPLTPVFNFDHGYKAYYDAHAATAEEVMDAVNKARELAHEAGIIFTSHYLFQQEHPGKTELCGQPWLTLGVRVDGRVFTCCGTPEKMGHLGESEFHEIWNGDAYQRLRRTLYRKEFPEFCSLCVQENRASHFNEDLLFD